MRWLATFWASLTSILAVSSGASGVGTDKDEAAWAEAERAATSEAYQHYLVEFPVGRHNVEALRSLVDDEQTDETMRIAGRFKDKGERGRPDSFGPPGRPDIGPPGLY
jgi:hypothetical protein